MKIKRFDNLWTMGFILFGAILALFYVAKIFFPEFIVGIAEIPSIVAFGNFVDNHLWAGILFHFVISYIGGYLYCCACYRKYKLNLIESICIFVFISLTIFIQYFAQEIYTPFLYVTLIVQPFLMLAYHKNLNEKTATSLCICFSVDILAQALSMVIRNVVLLATQINTATITILLIDTWIWRILLYMFFNYKNKKEGK